MYERRKNNNWVLSMIQIVNKQLHKKRDQYINVRYHQGKNTKKSFDYLRQK